MGVVYSPEAVKRGEIPEPGAHKAAGLFLLDKLFDNDNPNGIVAGMIYGSTVFDQEKVRSDLDILVLNDINLGRVATNALRKQIQEAHRRFHVVVEPHASYADRNPSLGDSMYVNYLAEVARQVPEWTRNNPLSHMIIEPVTPETVRRDATLYVERKAIKFSAICATSEELDVKSLQRAFELPSAIGRKAAALIELERNGSDLSDRRSLAKTALSSLVELGETDLTIPGIEAHHRLVVLNKEYTGELHKAMNGGSVVEYTKWLNDVYSLAYQDAQALAGAWLEALTLHHPNN